jgi:hypothetical protein
LLVIEDVIAIIPKRQSVSHKPVIRPIPTDHVRLAVIMLEKQ